MIIRYLEILKDISTQYNWAGPMNMSKIPAGRLSSGILVFK